MIGTAGVLEGTLGCSEFDAAAVADARSVMDTKEPTIRTYEHDLGRLDVFLDPQPVPPTLVVCGATPVAEHLARWGHALGYEVILYEQRAERVTRAHRRAARSIATSPEDLSIDRATVVVHTDHDAPDVASTLAVALKGDAAFIGVMGSARHVGPHLEELKRAGFTAAELERIHSPVGLDLGGSSPAEIALSIAAGIVAERNSASGSPLDAPSGD